MPFLHSLNNAATLPRWVHFCPQVAGLLGCVTLIVCIFVNRLLDQDIGGVPWPYLSETGKTGAPHVLFSIGFTLTAVTLVPSVYFFYLVNQNFYASFDGAYDVIPSYLSKIAVVNLVSGMCIPLPLALVALLDTSNFPTAHSIMAYLASIAYVIFVASATVFTYWKRGVPSSHLQFRRAHALSFRSKAILSALVGISFMIYLPIGLGLVYSNDNCFDYDEETKQWDYSNCVGINVSRAIAQHLFIIFLTFFTVTLGLDIDMASGSNAYSAHHLSSPVTLRRSTTIENVPNSMNSMDANDSMEGVIFDEREAMAAVSAGTATIPKSIPSAIALGMALATSSEVEVTQNKPSTAMSMKREELPDVMPVTPVDAHRTDASSARSEVSSVAPPDGGNKSEDVNTIPGPSEPSLSTNVATEEFRKPRTSAGAGAYGSVRRAATTAYLVSAGTTASTDAAIAPTQASHVNQM